MRTNDYMMFLTLRDGMLFEYAVRVFPDADYFTTVEEAERWLEENQIEAEVTEE